VTVRGFSADGAYRRTEGDPIPDDAREPNGVEFVSLLDKLIARVMKTLTRAGHLFEERGLTNLAETAVDDPMASLVVRRHAAVAFEHRLLSPATSGITFHPSVGFV